MKQYILILIIIITTTMTSSYKEVIFKNRDLNQIMFIDVIAIDNSKNQQGGIDIILTSKSGYNSENEGKQDIDIIKSNGRTIFDAIRNSNKLIEKKINCGHIKYLVIGEGAAKKDIGKNLDFFLRDNQIGLNIKVLIAKNSTAKNSIKVMKKNIDINGRLFSDMLDRLFNKVELVSISSPVNLYELARDLNNGKSSFFLPHINVSDENIKLDGYSVFKKRILHKYLSEVESKGLNILKNKFKSSVIVVTDERGDDISIEVKKTFSKIVYKSKNSFDINIVLKSSIGEYQGYENIFTKEYLNIIEEKQKAILKSYIEKILDTSKKDKFDILEILNLYIREQKFENKAGLINFEDDYLKDNFTINIDSIIERTYGIKQSISQNRIKN